MKLNDFAGMLINEGLIVFSVSNGDIVDFLTVVAPEKTLITRTGGRLAVRRLDSDERIVSVQTLTDSLKTAAKQKSDI